MPRVYIDNIYYVNVPEMPFFFHLSTLFFSDGIVKSLQIQTYRSHIRRELMDDVGTCVCVWVCVGVRVCMRVGMVCVCGRV